MNAKQWKKTETVFDCFHSQKFVIFYLPFYYWKPAEENIHFCRRTHTSYRWRQDYYLSRKEIITFQWLANFN